MKYKAHPYQAYATNFILEHPIATILLDMGLGKSVITLTAINQLIQQGQVHKVLVIAPLRVAKSTWPNEIQKWDHLKGLSYSVVIGSPAQRKAALLADTDLYIINRENVKWLVEDSGVAFDFDMLVIDELSSFKSYQAKRFRSLMKVRPLVKRVVGLTGTPSSNGLMDLWAEFKVLDMGQRLGRYISHYRERYFLPDKRNQYVVWTYKPKPHAEEAIYDQINDITITISMRSKDYLQMPPLTMNQVKVKLSSSEQAAYDTLKNQLIVEVKHQQINALNAASLANKLSQMANGCVYDEDKHQILIHQRKLDALEDLKDCQNGQVDLVLTKSISRFSRNTTDCLRIIRQLKQLDIPVIFEKENINTGSMDSELILSVLGSLAQDESQSIAHNVRLGYQQRANNGVFHYSIPPYGYQKDANRDLIIDPIERKVVLRIFNWTIEGKSPGQIAKLLNEQAISTKRNGKWHDSTIRGILQNTVYLGTTEFQKTFTDDEYHRHPNQGEQGKIIIEEHHPAIIDQATFTQVQKIIMLKRKFYPQAKAKPQRHTFSRKIYCGNCQKLFKRQSRSGKVCWGCQTHIKHAKDCPVKSIREDALQLAFCTMVNKLIFSQKFLLEPLVKQLQARQNQEQAAKLSQVETELKEAKDKQDNLQQLRKQELIEKDFFTKQDAELEQEIANLQSEIERLKQLLGGQNSKLPLTHELLKLCQRSNYLTAFNAELFEQIIESITVDQDHNLTFHIKCGLNLTEGSKHHVKA